MYIATCYLCHVTSLSIGYTTQKCGVCTHLTDEFVFISKMKPRDNQKRVGYIIIRGTYTTLLSDVILYCICAQPYGYEWSLGQIFTGRKQTNGLFLASSKKSVGYATIQPHFLDQLSIMTLSSWGRSCYTSVA